MADYEESQLDYIRPEPSHSRSDLSLCATLLSLFDFGAHGYVTRKDWDRGLSTLLLGGLSEDESLWVKLLELYDPEDKGAVKLAAVRDLLPIDPRISVLLQQLVHSVAGCREYVAQATKKAVKSRIHSLTAYGRGELLDDDDVLFWHDLALSFEG